MAADPFNSLGGYPVGIPAIEVIDSNGNVVSNFLNLSGNVSANKVYANFYYWSNGQPFSSSPGGSNTQLQFNNNGIFGGIPDVTYNGSILNLGDIANLNIGGGVNGYFLQTGLLVEVVVETEIQVALIHKSSLMTQEHLVVTPDLHITKIQIRYTLKTFQQVIH